jgi:hypothetical protein
VGAALAALLAAYAAAAPADDAAARLRSAEEAIASVEATGCPAGVDPERAVRDSAAGSLPPDAASALDAAREDLRLYFACRAYGGGSPEGCAPLSKVPARVVYSVDKSALKRPDTLDFLCASDLLDMRMARATIAGDRAAFVAACRAHDDLGHRDYKRGRVDEACALLADGARDPRKACDALGPLFSNPAPAGFCRDELAQFAGDEARCAAIEGQPASRELCFGYAAWKRARAGDAAACAASPVCRVLAAPAEAAQACAPLASRVMTGVCAAHYRPAALRAAAADLDAAERLLERAPDDGTPARSRALRDDATAEGCARARLRLARLLKAAPGFPAAGSAVDEAGARVREGLKAVDELLERAEAKVAGLESAARGRAAGTGCPPGVGVKELSDDLRSGRLAKELGGDLPEDGAKLDWQVYHMCLALATGDAGACAQADAISAQKGVALGGRSEAATYSDNCAVYYHQTRAVAARVRGDAKASQVCEDALPHLADFKDAASVTAVCRAWQADRGGGDHEPMLAAMSAGLRRPPKREYLLTAVREMLADPEYCPKMPNDYEAAACRALDEYRRALAGGAKCSSGLCRALSGDGPAACEPYSRTFLRAACLNGYAGAYAADSQKAFEGLADKVQKALDQLDAAAQAPQERAAVAARYERFYGQRERLDRAYAAYAPASALKRSP